MSRSLTALALALTLIAFPGCADAGPPATFRSATVHDRGPTRS